MSGDSLKVIESPLSLMGFLSCTDIQEFYEVTLLDSQRWVESSKVADTVTPVNLWDFSSLQSTTVTSDTLPSLSTSIEVRVISGLEVMWFVSVTMVKTKLSLCHLHLLYSHWRLLQLNVSAPNQMTPTSSQTSTPGARCCRAGPIHFRLGKRLLKREPDVSDKECDIQTRSQVPLTRTKTFGPGMRWFKSNC